MVNLQLQTGAGASVPASICHYENVRQRGRRTVDFAAVKLLSGRTVDFAAVKLLSGRTVDFAAVKLLSRIS